MNPVNVFEQAGPIILGQPHGGTFVPADIWMSLNERGQKRVDTDWRIGDLYADLHPSATIVSANFHRYVIDANRSASNESLYPGQNTTGLCPVTDFAGLPIYQPGMEPDAEQIKHRITNWHQPYHQAIEAQIARVKQLHGIAILFDCHSISRALPYLFEGDLPTLNIGTDHGTTCAPAIEQTVCRLVADSTFTWVLNGRFRGGWTTRHYGQPSQNVHAIQMEITRDAYLEQDCEPWNFSPAKSATLRKLLRAMLRGIEELAPSLRQA